MPYIGRDLNRGNYLKLDDISSSFNSSTTTFNLTVGGSAFRPGSAFSILVSVGGVIQEPESSYQINNSEITFANAPTAQDSFFCIALAVPIGIGVPGNGAVNGAQIAKPFNYDGFFFLDDANNRVGIGSLQPTVALDVDGIVKASSFSGGSGGINAGVGTFTGLDVNGNGDISGNLVLGGDLTVNGTTTTLDTNLIGVDRIEVGANSSTVVGVAVTQSGTADIVNLFDGTTEVLTVVDGGDVGIGTATIDSSYGTNLNIHSSGNNTGARIKLTDGTSGTGNVDGFDIFGVNGRAYVFNRENYEMVLGTDNKIRLRIDDDGAISVGHNPGQSTGTNTQNAILTLKGYPNENESSAAILALIRGYNTTSATADHTIGRIVFGDKQAGEYAFIEGEVEANGAVGDTPGRLVFSTAPDNTSAPTEKLRIASNGNITVNKGNATANATLILSKGATGAAKLEFDEVNTQRAYIELDASEDLVHYAAANVEQKFYAGGGHRMTIGTSGDIAIGNHTPDGQLSIRAANASFPRLVISNTDNDENINLSTYHDSNGIYAFLGANAKLNSSGNITRDTTGHRSSGIFLDARNRGSIEFYTGEASGNPEERLRITSDGYIHLGTASALGTNKVGGQAITGQDYDPIVKVYSSSSNNWLAQLRSDHTTGNGVFLRAGNSSSTYTLYATGYDEQNSHLVVRGDGKVGIGTNNPLNPLEVWGSSVDLAIMDTQAYSQNSSGSAVAFQGYDSASVRKTFADIKGVANGSNIGEFAIRTRRTGGTLTEALRIDSSGRVLIGHTSSPTSDSDLLQVIHTDSGTGIAFHNYSASNYGNAINFMKSRSTSVGNTILQSGDRIGSLNFYGNDGSGRSLGAIIEAIVDDTPGNNNTPTGLYFATGLNQSLTTRLRITSGGLIGINRAPSYSGIFGGTQLGMHLGGSTAPFIRLTSSTSSQGDMVIQSGNSGADSHMASLADNGDISFWAKKSGASLKEIFKIRADGFCETMYSENTGSYNLSVSPTPRLRIRNDYGGDGIISTAQLYAKRGSGAASIFNIGVITTSTDYESNLVIQSRNTDATYSEKWRIESEGQLRMNYGDNAKQAYALRSTFRTITGHSSTGYQYVRFAFLAARTPYRVYIGTTGGNYGPGAQFFTVLRSWDSTTLYVTDKLNIGSAYANAVRMQSDNGGGDYYLELNINLTTTSQGFNAAIIPIGANAGTMRTALQFYGSDMSNLTNTSSAQSL